jgi:GNAT superfamily N-acetyltransferase
MGEVRFELLPEDDVPDESLALATELLGEAFGRRCGKAWFHRRPLYRVLAWDGDLLVGSEAAALIGCEPAIVVHGIGDAAVRPDRRGEGIARAMGALLQDEAIRRGADAVICDTGRLGPVAIEHGMIAVRPGELYLRRRLGLRQPLVAGWYVRWHAEKVAPLTIDGRV